MQKSVQAFRSNGEKFYQWIMVVVGALLWIIIGLYTRSHWANPKTGHFVHMYVGYGIAIAVFYWISGTAYRATAFGNMILLGPRQFPELHTMVVEGSQKIGLNEPPKTFIYNSNGIFNAFARRLLGGRYVFLTSALVDASSDAQVRFVLGHELGHHAAGHLSPWLNLLKSPAHLVPFLGKAYSRSREYTCDNIGAYLSANAHASRSALQMLGCGCRRLNASMNCDAFIAQEQMVPGLFGFLTEINRTHPRLTRRVAAINANITRDMMPGLSEPEFRISDIPQ
ncbi:MAG TPA: M48 family metallopeptidase [Paraburkholderia sp.]|jgi:Zn-dependent protease with chaperone function